MATYYSHPRHMAMGACLRRNKKISSGRLSSLQEFFMVIHPLSPARRYYIVYRSSLLLQIHARPCLLVNALTVLMYSYFKLWSARMYRQLLLLHDSSCQCSLLAMYAGTYVHDHVNMKMMLFLMFPHPFMSDCPQKSDSGWSVGCCCAL